MQGPPIRLPDRAFLTGSSSLTSRARWTPCRRSSARRRQVRGTSSKMAFYQRACSVPVPGKKFVPYLIACESEALHCVANAYEIDDDTSPLARVGGAVEVRSVRGCCRPTHGSATTRRFRWCSLPSLPPERKRGDRCQLRSSRFHPSPDRGSPDQRDAIAVATAGVDVDRLIKQAASPRWRTPTPPTASGRLWCSVACVGELGLIWRRRWGRRTCSYGKTATLHHRPWAAGFIGLTARAASVRSTPEVRQVTSSLRTGGTNPQGGNQ